MPTAPYCKAVEIAQAETVETIKVKYQEGTLDLEQVWSKREPHFVAVDWRQDPNAQTFKQTINLPRAKYNTLEKMLFNVGLPMNLARKSAAWFNERMPKWKAKEGEKVPEKCRPWTTGEGVKHWGVMVAACLCPTVPLHELWSDTVRKGDLFDPVAIAAAMVSIATGIGSSASCRRSCSR